MRQGEILPGHVVIIGSGIGGLTAGILLSLLNLRATVVEKNPEPGGLLRSYRRSGIDCPVGVHYLGGLDEGQPLRRLWDYLGITSLVPLERMGTRGPIDRYIYDDFSFDLPEGIAAFEDHLRCAFPLEEGQISPIMTDLREMSRSLARFDLFASPAVAGLSPENFASMGQRLRELGCSPRLMSVLGVPAALIGIPLEECPAYYYYMTLASYLMSSWRLAEGGTAMAEALASRLRSLGGEIVTGDGAAAIRVEAGRIKGVVLDSGRVLTGQTVIAAIHPRTMAAMLPPEVLRPAYRERVVQIENTKGLLGVNLAVDAASHPPPALQRLPPLSGRGGLPLRRDLSSIA